MYFDIFMTMYCLECVFYGHNLIMWVCDQITRCLSPPVIWSRSVVKGGAAKNLKADKFKIPIVCWKMCLDSRRVHMWIQWGPIGEGRGKEVDNDPTKFLNSNIDCCCGRLRGGLSGLQPGPAITFHQTITIETKT